MGGQVAIACTHLTKPQVGFDLPTASAHTNNELTASYTHARTVRPDMDGPPVSNQACLLRSYQNFLFRVLFVYHRLQRHTEQVRKGSEVRLNSTHPSGIQPKPKTIRRVGRPPLPFLSISLALLLLHSLLS